VFTGPAIKLSMEAINKIHRTKMIRFEGSINKTRKSMQFAVVNEGFIPSVVSTEGNKTTSEMIRI